MLTGEPALYLYGQPGTRITVETATNLGNPLWQAGSPFVMTGLYEVIKPVGVQPCTVHCRARRE